MRTSVCLLVVLALAAGGCGPRSCGSAGDGSVAQLLLQLKGGCCGFHTNPTEELIDDSCKPTTVGSSFTMRWSGGRSCVMWAAECLGQMEGVSAVVTPALIEAVQHGPNNYDTGDGVLPIRDKIVRALGQVGDERAVEPLVEALENPRAVDVGPGAVGYASKEPKGEAVALEALGLLGTKAAPALDRIVPYLMWPMEDARDERIVRAAADALGKIQAPVSIPALMEALTDPKRAPYAARALGEFGPGAEVAAPVLMGLIEEAPDREMNSLIRRAILQIRGKKAYRALPKDYGGMSTEIMRRISRLAKRKGIKLQRIHIDGPNDEVAPELATGETVHVEFDRAAWMERREVTGRVRVTREQTELSVADYSGLEQLDGLLAQVFEKAG